MRVIREIVYIVSLAFLAAMFVVIYNHTTLDCNDFFVKFCVASWH